MKVKQYNHYMWLTLDDIDLETTTGSCNSFDGTCECIKTLRKQMLSNFKNDGIGYIKQIACNRLENSPIVASRATNYKDMSQAKSCLLKNIHTLREVFLAKLQQHDPTLWIKNNQIHICAKNGKPIMRVQAFKDLQSEEEKEYDKFKQQSQENYSDL